VIADFGLSRVVGTTPDSADVRMAGTDGAPASDAAAAQPHLTSYVVTRWYRAPELLVGCHAYDAAVDVWSVGCILFEMIARRPLLPGRNYKDQLRVTLDVIGAPPDKQLGWLRELPAYKAVRAQVHAVHAAKKPAGGSGGGGGAPAGGAYGLPALARLLPTADPQAVDLLARMLQFDPACRITVEQALLHPFVADYHDASDEPVAAPPPSSFFEFEERGPLTRAAITELMLAEVARFGAPPRPASTRLSAHALAQPALQMAAAAAVAAGSASADPAPRTMELDDAEPGGSGSGGGAGAVPGPLQPPAAAAAGFSADQLLSALTSHMRAMKDEIVSHVDGQVGALGARLGALEARAVAAPVGSAGGGLQPAGAGAAGAGQFAGPPA